MFTNLQILDNVLLECSYKKNILIWKSHIYFWFCGDFAGHKRKNQEKSVICPQNSQFWGKMEIKNSFELVNCTFLKNGGSTFERYFVSKFRAQNIQKGKKSEISASFLMQMYLSFRESSILRSITNSTK